MRSGRVTIHTLTLHPNFQTRVGSNHNAFDRNGSSVTANQARDRHWGRPNGAGHRVSLYSDPCAPPLLPPPLQQDWTDHTSYVAALHAKVPVTLYDPSPAVLSTSLRRLDKLFARDVEKGRLDAGVAEAARERVQGCEGDGTGLEGTREMQDNVDLVVEVRLRLPFRLAPGRR